MKVLCVAEKPSIAKSITGILSGGHFSNVSVSMSAQSWLTSDQRESAHRYIRNYDFSYNLPPPLGQPGYSDFTVTAVLGHLTSSVSHHSLGQVSTLTMPSHRTLERNVGNGDHAIPSPCSMLLSSPQCPT